MALSSRNADPINQYARHEILGLSLFLSGANIHNNFLACLTLVFSKLTKHYSETSGLSKVRSAAVQETFAGLRMSDLTDVCYTGTQLLLRVKSEFTRVLS